MTAKDWELAVGGAGGIGPPARPAADLMLVKSAIRYIEQHRLLEEGDRVLVALSGGPDSLCLLHLLCALRLRYRLYLAVAHLDHGIRAEARQEAERVRRLAEEWRLPFVGAAVDMPAFRRGQRLSPSEASRILRYRFLLKAAEKQGAGKIALGHQLDDQAETVLFNLIRGTGPDGLAGILPRRPLGPVELIRPLLATTREEIENYCREKELAPILDPSNLQRTYTRNRIRLELIPHLEKSYNPRLKRALAGMAALVEADRSYLREASQKEFARLSRFQGDRLLLERAAFAALPPALRGRVARLALSTCMPAKKIGRRQVEQLLRLAEGEGPARQLSLTARTLVRRSYDRLIFFRTPQDGAKQAQLTALPLQVPGRTVFGGGSTAVEAALCRPGELSWPPSPQQAYLDYDTLPPSLQLRGRRPGDRFYPQGAPGGKKLKNYLIDRKVPRHRRDHLPLVVAGSEVVWVAGERIAHPFRVTGKTGRVLHLRLVQLK